MHRIVASKIVLILHAFESIVVIDKIDCPPALALSYQAVRRLTSCIIKFRNTIIQYIVLHSKIKCQSILTSILNTPPKLARIAFVILYHREEGSSMLIIIIHVRHVKTLAVIIAKAIVVHHVNHPLSIRTAHLTYRFAIVCEIACIAIVSFTSISIISRPCCFPPAIVIRIPIHLISSTNIATIYLKFAILTEILFIETAPSILTTHMVYHHICNHLGTSIVKHLNQVLQLCTCSPI